MKKIAIVGSRKFDNYEFFKEFIDKYLQDCPDIQIHFVSGGAIGTDSLAEKYAYEEEIPIDIYYPDWETFGKSAGRIRNQEIIDTADELIAFWDGISPGTKMTISFAKKKGIPYKVVKIDGLLIY